ncbi:uncharacterized protein BT62DRAFT_1019535 [Guyanagaster necrorhizus]|uniref:Uncharacterized protein n=1 Tax=Guyanagaster necrorhizus TaxID=856835 RepID=A0A9P7VVQ7_9AGAR|nr:uncharacterized protein BT62DRAFT_1019535 [Guyanagaster necrorhizus MCA 3950]KAG7447432.1 hypothetical protein BT62DRAFT_1019535 [Guyanagaster necrorhizus MCA 3950]
MEFWLDWLMAEEEHAKMVKRVKGKQKERVKMKCTICIEKMEALRKAAEKQREQERLAQKKTKKEQKRLRAEKDAWRLVEAEKIERIESCRGGETLVESMDYLHRRMLVEMRLDPAGPETHLVKAPQIEAEYEGEETDSDTEDGTRASPRKRVRLNVVVPVENERKTTAGCSQTYACCKVKKAVCSFNQESSASRVVGNVKITTAL